MANYSIVVPDVSEILNQGVTATKDDASITFKIDLSVFEKLSLIAVLDKIRHTLISNGVEDDEP